MRRRDFLMKTLAAACVAAASPTLLLGEHLTPMRPMSLKMSRAVYDSIQVDRAYSDVDFPAMQRGVVNVVGTDENGNEVSEFVIDADWSHIV